MRNMIFAYVKTKMKVSCAGNPSADQHLCFRYIDSTIPLLPNLERVVCVVPVRKPGGQVFS